MLTLQYMYNVHQRVGRLYVGMAPTRPLSLNKNDDSELSNAAVLSLFRCTACSTSVFLHGKTLKVGKIHCYNGTQKFLKRQFLHHHLLLLQAVYLKIDKCAHLCFSIKRFLSLRCMILGQQNRRKISLAGERQGFTSTSV